MSAIRNQITEEHVQFFGVSCDSTPPPKGAKGGFSFQSIISKFKKICHHINNFPKSKISVHFVLRYRVCRVVISMTPYLLRHTTEALIEHLKRILKLLNLENAQAVGAASDGEAAQKKVTVSIADIFSLDCYTTFQVFALFPGRLIWNHDPMHLLSLVAKAIDKSHGIMAETLRSIATTFRVCISMNL